MDWLKVLLGFLQAFNAVVNYLATKQLLNAGGLSAIAEALQGQANAISQGQAARQEMRDAAARDPSSILRDDDGFKRKKR